MLKIPAFGNPTQRVVSRLLASLKRQIHKRRLGKHLLLFLAPAIRTVQRVARPGR
jgi:hypothetical protein